MVAERERGGGGDVTTVNKEKGKGKGKGKVSFSSSSSSSTAISKLSMYSPSYLVSQRLKRVDISVTMYMCPLVVWE